MGIPHIFQLLGERAAQTSKSSPALHEPPGAFKAKSVAPGCGAFPPQDASGRILWESIVVPGRTHKSKENWFRRSVDAWEDVWISSSERCCECGLVKRGHVCLGPPAGGILAERERSSRNKAYDKAVLDWLTAKTRTTCTNAEANDIVAERFKLQGHVSGLNELSRTMGEDAEKARVEADAAKDKAKADAQAAKIARKRVKEDADAAKAEAKAQAKAARTKEREDAAAARTVAKESADAAKAMAKLAKVANAAKAAATEEGTDQEAASALLAMMGV